ncbi:MAG TPA: GNAT family N-acetyltransferase [Galbitalea sp.]
MRTLTTERLTLRPWTPDDADFVLDMYSRWEVQRFIGLAPRLMENRSEALERIARWSAEDDPIQGIQAVEVTATGQLVGNLLLKSIPASGDLPLQPSGDTEIGWHFHPDYWGNGYASEAASAGLALAWTGDLARVVAVTNPENSASQAVCLRIGMRHDGQTDRYYNATCELFVAERPAA